MKRIGLALVLMFAFSLLPKGKPGSVMAGIGHVLTPVIAPVAHAQYVPPMDWCSNDFRQIEDIEFNFPGSFTITGSSILYWADLWPVRLYTYTVSPPISDPPANGSFPCMDDQYF